MTSKYFGRVLTPWLYPQFSGQILTQAQNQAQIKFFLAKTKYSNWALKCSCRIIFILFYFILQTHELHLGKLITWRKSQCIFLIKKKTQVAKSH